MKDDVGEKEKQAGNQSAVGEIPYCKATAGKAAVDKEIYLYIYRSYVNEALKLSKKV